MAATGNSELVEGGVRLAPREKSPLTSGNRLAVQAM
jgi:hypothetical protein